jgi:AcrR family transcriptional regulator
MVIKIKRGIKEARKEWPKRLAGERAGLSRVAILAAAAELLEAEGDDGFSLRKLAKVVGVVPTTIHAHFKGGLDELQTQLAATALADVARPYKPQEPPEDYLRELFLKVLAALHGRPHLARIVVFELSTNPVLVPHLAERLLVCLAELGLGKEDLPYALRRALGAIQEMILIESMRSNPPIQKKAAKDLGKNIAVLSPTEFPNLVELIEQLQSETVNAATQAPSADVAGLYVDRLMGAFQPA